MPPIASASRRIFYAMPFGWICVELQGESVTGVDLQAGNPSFTAAKPDDPKADDDILVDEVHAAFLDYLTNPDRLPALRFETRGTHFQQRVWRLLRNIPSGRVMTYGEAARELGSSPRAVGSACRANPTPIIVPCHRIVAQGGLGGFSGATEGPALKIKQWLLRHEGAIR